ncbi:MAG: GDP-mannose 4,6-dehydratase [Bacteroidia bacterium]|nr:GDP-mannose 4,6-dehydratase [Bacteroidia bacterium]
MNSLNKPHVLITGGAGFIGSHLADSLLEDGYRVSVLDNLDPYYPVELKRINVSQHESNPDYTFIEGDILDKELLDGINDLDGIVHLAARAGVRPSIKDPVSYMETNVKGTQNMLELARAKEVKQFVFASSSSVYGINPNVPWSESDYVLKPISPYAASKVSGELIGHTYSHLYGIRFIALRFFTVFGPRQRPDLAINKFARHILQGKSIPVFGDGTTRRDYTYVADIVSGIRGALAYQGSMYEIVNLGAGRTISLAEMIEAIEEVIGQKAIIDRQPEQPGDVPLTSADITKANQLFGYQPNTTFKQGLENFREWLIASVLQNS